MSLRLLAGIILIVSSIAMSALIIFPLRLRGSRREQLDVEACKARLEGIEAGLKLGKLNEAEADAERLALLSQLQSSSWGFGQDLRRAAARTLTAPAAVFLLVAGVGAAISYVADPPSAAGSADTSSFSDGGTGSDGEMLASLTDYAGSIGAEQPASPPADGKLLPDVNTMIERLATRLETAPEDVNGWRMLGWSYLQVERYDQAATAYAKALELDPNSAELKRSYEEAKAKTSDRRNVQASPTDTSAAGPGAEKMTASEVTPPHQSNAAIRSMVDGLADRLQSSPRDVEGWTRLMRSRVVLGEKEVAASAFRKALDVFKDDAAASAKITAAAIELGLTAE
jgi:cytochrome c-type biogenesis protein CcmH/NrfG